MEQSEEDPDQINEERYMTVDYTYEVVVVYT